jgi:hypothetical protein
LNLNLWSAIREYIAAEVRLAVLRHQMDGQHPCDYESVRALGDEIRVAEMQSTRMETYIREHMLPQNGNEEQR